MYKVPGTIYLIIGLIYGV